MITLLTMASQIHPAEQEAQSEAEEMSFFEYLGSMVDDGESGWIDPLDMEALEAEPVQDQAVEEVTE